MYRYVYLYVGCYFQTKCSKMLDDFFKLNGTPQTIGKNSESEFKTIVDAEETVQYLVYLPDILENDKKHPRYKIRRRTFINVSFTKTKLRNLDFTACHFQDCFFIGTEIVNCQFHQCSFENVNTHQIKIKRTYIDPISFKKDYTKKEIE